MYDKRNPIARWAGPPVRWLQIMCGWAMLAVCFATLYDIVARRLFAHSVQGVTEVGAYLLGLWGLPSPVVEAVAWHHRPRDCPQQTFSALTAVHAANILDQGAASAEGTAEVLDEDGTRTARAIVARKYVLSRVGNWLAKTFRLPKAPVIGISVTL